MNTNIRVSQFLDEQHITFETMVHPPAYTAQKRAKRLAISGYLVAKCVLLAGPAGYYLAVLPATHQVDLFAVAEVVGSPVRLAHAEEMEELFTDCEYGALAPFGRLYGLSTLLDESLALTGLMTFEAQRHTLAIRMRSRDFETLEQPRRFRFARLPAERTIPEQREYHAL